jgi:AcrR family transcriptional regulator
MAECCAERGYAETSLAAVLDRAGVDERTFHALFADKEACALAALNRILSDTVSCISIAERGRPGASIEQRHAELRAILELLAARPSFARLMLIEARQSGTAAMRETYRSSLSMLALLLSRAAGGEGGGSERIARAALGGAEALVRRELAAGQGEAMPELLGEVIYAALVPLLGQGEALRQATLATGNQEGR